jgi:hypothetical protein
VGDSQTAGCMRWGHSPMGVRCMVHPAEEGAGHNHLHHMNPEEVLGEDHRPRRAELLSRPWCHRSCRWHPT